jgi:DNA-binding MarR family transcriptional regulator
LTYPTVYHNNDSARYPFLIVVVTSETSDRSKPQVPDELLASSVYLLKRLGFMAKEQGMKAYEEVGLHPYHHAVMSVLDEGSRETQGAIADALGYDRGQLVGLLDELEERGLVERRRDPADRRRHIVVLTPAGRRTLGRLRKLAREIEDEFLAPLGEDQRRELHRLLRRLAGEHLPHGGPGAAAKPA